MNSPLVKYENINSTQETWLKRRFYRLRIWVASFGIAFLVTSLLGKLQAEEGLSEESSRFLTHQCLDCHNATDPAGGLDLSAITQAQNWSEHFDTLVRVVDRVEAGEMPPPESAQPSDEERAQFVIELGKRLKAHQTQEFATSGRVQGRRLTNLQLERTLQDLLGIDIPLASLMSEEQRTAGFATVASGQSMSHFQLEEHLKVVDAALSEAFRRAAIASDEFEVEFDALGVARKDPKKRCREPEMIDDLAVVWSSRLIFYGRLPVTAAKQDGWYEFKVRASARRKPEQSGVWCTVRSGPCISSAPLLAWVGAFEAQAEPQEWTFIAWLPKGHMLEIRPGDTTLKMANFQGGQVGAGEGEPQNVAGLNLHGVTMRRIHLGLDDAGIRKALFDDLEVVEQTIERGQRRKDQDLMSLELKTLDAEEDLRRLIHRFAEKAFRSAITHEHSRPFVELAIKQFRQGQAFLESLRLGYRSILCSPRFLYLQEAAGTLDGYELANRLSYMLWNSMPDEELMNVARSGRLTERSILQDQVERMLSSKRGQSFVRDLATEWLDLRLIDFTEPDRRLYPSFDIIVQQSMLEETYRTLQEMLERDASVTELIDSDFTYLNSRLARFYGIDGVEGDRIQRWRLKETDQRGGILTQGSILKVTANGTTTSPVIRGVWVSERLLGEHIPPPPQGVPAVEPDIRGATSIRELLAKHRSNEACAVCHVKIDPPGFALENYDPAGRFRTVYASIDKKKGSGINVDPSYVTAEGQEFADVKGFRRIVCEQPEKLAKNMVEKLIIVGTGALPTYADRDSIQTIVEECRHKEHGIRALIHAVVNSEVFRRK